MLVTDKAQALSKNDSAIGLCTTENIIEKWSVSAKQTCSILRMSSNTYARAKKR